MVQGGGFVLPLSAGFLKFIMLQVFGIERTFCKLGSFEKGYTIYRFKRPIYLCFLLAFILIQIQCHKKKTGLYWLLALSLDTLSKRGKEKEQQQGKRKRTILVVILASGQFNLVVVAMSVRHC